MTRRDLIGVLFVFALLGVICVVAVLLPDAAYAHAGHYTGQGTHSVDWNTREVYVTRSGAHSAWHHHLYYVQELTWRGWVTEGSFWRWVRPGQ